MVFNGIMQTIYILYNDNFFQTQYTNNLVDV